MKWLTEIEWAAWVQAVSAVVALLVGPQALRVVWEFIATRFRVVAKPHAGGRKPSSTRWQLTIQNESRAMHRLSARFYPARQGNIIAFAEVKTTEDGGLSGISAILDRGALKLSVDHFAPTRNLVVDLIFTNDDVIDGHSEDGRMKIHTKFEDEKGKMPSSVYIPIAHTRLMMLLINFYLGFLMLIVRLIYIGIEHMMKT